VAQPVATAELAVVNTWLVDTGPLVAHLDGADRAHPEVTERLDDFAGALVTSSAVAVAIHRVTARAPAGDRPAPALDPFKMLSWLTVGECLMPIPEPSHPGCLPFAGTARSPAGLL